MEEIRAFIALDLPPEVKTTLSAVLDELAPCHLRAVKWVKPESIHLTLKFLGDIPFPAVTKISGVLAQAVEGCPAIELGLKGLGAFPNLRSPRVVWVGIEGDVRRVRSLQKSVDNGLAALGFPREKRPFSPHLTLGRVRDGVVSRDRLNLAEVVSSFQIPRNTSFAVERISLIKSTLTRSGPIYERLTGCTLDRNPAE